jgi:hypothetical protein
VIEKLEKNNNEMKRNKGESIILNKEVLEGI